MHSDKFGNIILDEADIITGLYNNSILDLNNVNIQDSDIINEFNRACDMTFEPYHIKTVYHEPNISISEYDQKNQSSWFMPDQYQNLDIGGYLFSLCKSDEEINRVAQELELYHQYQMIDVLKYIKYLVDTMRDNNILWGVGRGSSVASFCLFLIGAHRINSLKYNLDIHEFLK